MKIESLAEEFGRALQEAFPNCSPSDMAWYRQELERNALEALRSAYGEEIPDKQVFIESFGFNDALEKLRHGEASPYFSATLGRSYG